MRGRFQQWVSGSQSFTHLLAHLLIRPLNCSPGLMCALPRGCVFPGAPALRGLSGLWAGLWWRHLQNSSTPTNSFCGGVFKMWRGLGKERSTELPLACLAETWNLLRLEHQGRGCGGSQGPGCWLPASFLWPLSLCKLLSESHLGQPVSSLRSR